MRISLRGQLRFVGHMSVARKRQNIALAVDDVTLMELGFVEASSGVIVFLRTPGRDIHLTYYLRDDQINCHITDTAKHPSKVWEVEVSAKELSDRLMRSLKRSLTRYNWNETYYMLQEPLMQMMRQFSSFPEESGRFNLLDTFRIFSSVKGEDDLLVRTRIRDGLKMGPRLGFQYSATQAYIVIPMDEKMCLRMNADIRRGFLGKTPFAIGIWQYFKYLETELTDADVYRFLDKSTIEKARTTIEAAFLASGARDSTVKP